MQYNSPGQTHHWLQRAREHHALLAVTQQLIAQLQCRWTGHCFRACIVDHTGWPRQRCGRVGYCSTQAGAGASASAPQQHSASLPPAGPRYCHVPHKSTDCCLLYSEVSGRSIWNQHVKAQLHLNLRTAQEQCQKLSVSGFQSTCLAGTNIYYQHGVRDAGHLINMTRHLSSAQCMVMRRT